MLLKNPPRSVVGGGAGAELAGGAWEVGFAAELGLGSAMVVAGSAGELNAEVEEAGACADDDGGGGSTLADVLARIEEVREGSTAEAGCVFDGKVLVAEDAGDASVDVNSISAVVRG